MHMCDDVRVTRVRVNPAYLPSSTKFRPMNLRTSSMSHTGAAAAHTNSHSLKSSGTMLKIVASAGTYRIRKWSANELNMARISHGLIHGGMTISEMSSDIALHALNISMTTSVVSDSVDALTLPAWK